MRFLGIDYGTKRVGIALTNEDGTMAFPHTTLPNDKALVTAVTSLVYEKAVDAVVIGRSHDLSDVPNAVQTDIDAFVAVLTEKLAVPIYAEPEQFSTQAALRLQGRTKETDASAAALILDAYITRQRHNEKKGHT